MNHEQRDQTVSRKYVQLDPELISSEAWRALTAKQMHIFIRFLQKREWYKVPGRRKGKIKFYPAGRDDGGYIFTYAEAKRIFKVSSSTFRDAVIKFVNVGLLDIKHRGCRYTEDSTRYVISDRWKHYGRISFQTVEYQKHPTPFGFDKWSDEKILASKNRSGNIKLVNATASKNRTGEMKPLKKLIAAES